jgi:hypothetical protein
MLEAKRVGKDGRWREMLIPDCRLQNEEEDACSVFVVRSSIFCVQKSREKPVKAPILS